MVKRKCLLVLCGVVLIIINCIEGELTQNCNERIDSEISMLRKEFMEKMDEISKENALLKLEVSKLNQKIVSYDRAGVYQRGLDYSDEPSLSGGNRRSHIGKRAEPVIAFHAYLSHGLGHLGYRHTILFDKEMTDEGPGYNPFTGIYTIPETGIYVISWTITVKHTMCATELMLNSSVIGESYPDSEHDSDNDTATEIVIREFEENDAVFVRAKSGCSSIRSDTVVRSSFSGWKL